MSGKQFSNNSLIVCPQILFMRKLSIYCSCILFATLLFAGCDKDDAAPPAPAPFAYPDSAFTDVSSLLLEQNGVKVYNTGYGSAIVKDPNTSDIFYLMTDRGPNVDGAVPDSKVFAKPDFAPQIGKFKLENGQLKLIQNIVLKNKDGANLNGLPNPAGTGGTGETAYNLTGAVINPSADGLDPEGLAIASDGSFWISDEYGPHILHTDASGKTIERINPFGSGTGGRKIPQVFIKRRPNRGMEGLTITPDGKTLVGMMQSPLYNPSRTAVSGSKIIRILFFDIASGSTKQYAYVLETSSTLISEIAAISNTSFLVLERDGDYPKDPTKPSQYKRFYKIDITAATDISDASDGATGKLYNGKSVDELKDAASLTSNSIVPVTKTLVSDLLIDKPFYTHDKPEGVTIINDKLIAVANDDDFGIVDNGAGGFKEKTLPATGKVDKNIVYFIKLSAPLK